jgi:hypothetical protein
MSAFNVVRFRVKPGRDQEFLDAHRSVDANWPGLKKVSMIKTGNQTHRIIAEWADVADMAAARPNMIATLNSFRIRWRNWASLIRCRDLLFSN